MPDAEVHPTGERVARVEGSVDTIKAHLFTEAGGLETRLRGYVDQRDQHRKLSTNELVENVIDIMNRNDERTERRHVENTRTNGRLTWMVGIGFGIVLTLQAVAMLMLAIWKGTLKP